jgi:hypothetical protein
MLKIFHFLVGSSKRRLAVARLDFLLVQDDLEGFVAAGAIKKSNCQFSFFTCFVWATCHFPAFSGASDFGSAVFTLYHFSFFLQ